MELNGFSFVKRNVYIPYMVAFNIPLYMQRWKEDQANGVTSLTFLQGPPRHTRVPQRANRIFNPHPNYQTWARPKYA